jgi:hypothetical protein
MNLPNCPTDRPMNSDEQRGFNMACACLMRWGRQIEHNGVSLGGDTATVPRRDLMRHAGRMVRGCAEALALTLGAADRPKCQPNAELAPARLPKAG